MITRKDYMTKKATHREYYGQLVTPEIIRTVASFIGGDKLLASTDEHLNDISLAHWDAMHQFLPPYYMSAMIETDPNCGRSLSNTVCVAKEAARQWIEAQEVLANGD